MFLACECVNGELSYGTFGYSDIFRWCRRQGKIALLYILSVISDIQVRIRTLVYAQLKIRMKKGRRVWGTDVPVHKQYIRIH